MGVALYRWGMTIVPKWLNAKVPDFKFGTHVHGISWDTTP